MRNRFFLATLLLMVNVASAQTACPQGVAAGSAQCGPSPNASSDSSTGSGYSRPVPSFKWKSTWGAIAGDMQGVYGIHTGLPSKRTAKKAALDECHKRGGIDCSVSFVFKNQCAAVGASEDSAFASAAPTEAEATVKAIRLCESEVGEGKCRLFYSGCSLAQHVW